MEQELELFLQGRSISLADIKYIKDLINLNPSWNRTRISKELCMEWDWRRANGGLKDIASRSLLRKLDALGHIQLPKGVHKNESSRRRNNILPMLHSKEPIKYSIKDLYPITVQLVETGYHLKLFKYFISTYHYLGWSGTVGENLKYLFYDKEDRPLGCIMFGAAAWKVKSRDDFIGWISEKRKKNLSFIINNNRFLILPWVNVPHLASHVLGKVCRRLNGDWKSKYNHFVYLVETFVQCDRFKGTCYRAANWEYLGKTKGRGKQDVHHQHSLPIKDILVYPLEKSFKKKLCS